MVAAIVVLKNRHIHPVCDGIEQRHLNAGALASDLAMIQRLEYGAMCCHPCGDIANRHPYLGGALLGTGDRTQTSFGLDDEIIGLEMGKCPLPKPRNVAVISRGKRRGRSADPKPSFSMLPGFRFWIKTSAAATSVSRTARSASDVRSKQTDSLPRCKRSVLAPTYRSFEQNPVRAFRP